MVVSYVNSHALQDDVRRWHTNLQTAMVLRVTRPSLLSGVLFSVKVLNIVGTSAVSRGADVQERGCPFEGLSLVNPRGGEQREGAG